MYVGADGLGALRRDLHRENPCWGSSLPNLCSLFLFCGFLVMAIYMYTNQVLRQQKWHSEIIGSFSAMSAPLGAPLLWTINLCSFRKLLSQ